MRELRSWIIPPAISHIDSSLTAAWLKRMEPLKSAHSIHSHSHLGYPCPTHRYRRVALASNWQSGQQTLVALPQSVLGNRKSFFSREANFCALLDWRYVHWYYPPTIRPSPLESYRHAFLRRLWIPPSLWFYGCDQGDVSVTPENPRFRFGALARGQLYCGWCWTTRSLRFSLAHPIPVLRWLFGGNRSCKVLPWVESQESRSNIIYISCPELIGDRCI